MYVILVSQHAIGCGIYRQSTPMPIKRKHDRDTTQMMENSSKANSTRKKKNQPNKTSTQCVYIEPEKKNAIKWNPFDILLFFF